jgi:hypothetical protein
MAEELPAVEFNARIEPPFEVPAVPPPTPPTPQRMERETETEPCCDYPSPPITYMGDAALVDALPTILISIGVAWVVGVCTGAFIFSTPSME